MTKASALTASSTWKTSDARPQGLLLSARPVLRQSLFKVAPSTISNVRRRRLQGFAGTARCPASGVQAMRVSSHACLTFGKGWVKQASTLGTPLCRAADSEVQIETDGH